MKVIGYTNSNFGECMDIKKSTSGYIFILARGVISWRNAKQTIVASSTMEAEFIACYETTSHALWLRNFIFGLRVGDSITFKDLL